MSPRLEESEVSIDHEEEESREHDAGIADANMEDKEEDEENVQVMSVEKELKHFSSDSWKCSSP